MIFKIVFVFLDLVVGVILEGFVEVNEVVILVVEVGLGEVVGVDDVIVEVVVVVVSFFKWGYVIWKVFVLILLFDVERKKSFCLIRGVGGCDYFKI